MFLGHLNVCVGVPDLKYKVLGRHPGRIEGLALMLQNLQVLICDGYLLLCLLGLYCYHNKWPQV